MCCFALTRGFGVKPLCAFRLLEGEARGASPLAAKREQKGEQDGKQNGRTACVMRGSIASLALAATPCELMEVAGFGDDALGSRVAARVPARMGFRRVGQAAV